MDDKCMAVDNRMDFRIQRDPISKWFRCWIIGDNGRSVATNVTMEPLESGHMLPGPTFSIGEQEIQWLMDELWRSGIRPTEVGTSGQVDAIKYHLEDMRKLVFEKKEQ